MNNLASEFKDIIVLYLKLGEELKKVMDVDDSRDPRILVESILQNRECLEQIAQMNSRVLRISENWKKCCIHFDPQSREDIRSLAETARSQAAQLHKLCSLHVETLKSVRGRLVEGLAEIGKGSQYIKCLKPDKNNYPKFIDTLH